MNIVDGYPIKDLTVISDFEKKQNITLPISYKNIIMEHDGGRIDGHYAFEYYDTFMESKQFLEFVFFERLGGLDKYGSSIPHVMKSEQYVEQPGLIPFSETGCGDGICFDYRKGSPYPPGSVVLYVYELEPPLNICLLSENFDDFINGLKPYVFEEEE